MKKKMRYSNTEKSSTKKKQQAEIKVTGQKNSTKEINQHTIYTKANEF